MIVNIPKAEELASVSLRLYFKAWAEVTSILEDWSHIFDMSRSRSFGNGKPANFKPDDDWRDYLENAQNDLQGIYTLVQQSQEIGIKARICEVSPFLLLKTLQAKPVTEGGRDYDFSDFQTIDAAELVRVHNMACDRPISDRFRELVEEIRRGRNKIHHLGILNLSLDPHAVVDVLQQQYVELYPDRRWMEDRREFGSMHRLDNWVDSNFTSTTSAMLELHALEPMLSATQFKRLTGHGQKERRYICHHCVSEANLMDTSVSASSVPTAFRIKGLLRAHCIVCDDEFELVSGTCPSERCGSVFASLDPDGELRCVTCGSTPDKIRRAEEEQEEMERFRARLPRDPFEDIPF